MKRAHSTLLRDERERVEDRERRADEECQNEAEQAKSQRTS